MEINVQHLLDAVGNQRNAALNEAATLAAQVKALQEKLSELEAKIQEPEPSAKT